MSEPLWNGATSHDTETFYSIIFGLQKLFIVLDFIFYNMKTWLKGGLIVAGIDLLFWLIYIFLIATCTGDICGLAGAAAIVYGLPSIILAFIVGAIIGVVSGIALKLEMKVITKSSKIGFIIGIFLSTLILIISAWSRYISLNQPHLIKQPTVLDYFGLPVVGYLILIVIPIVSAWIVWVISGLIKKNLKNDHIISTPK